TVIGWWWMRRLVRRADPPATSQVDASVLLELIAGALESGLPLARAVAAVAEALDAGPDASALARLASALEAGIPAALASSDLPPPLAALGESAVLAESSGADLAQVLRSAARDTRRSRARHAEERAAHLGVRLVLPPGVALLPAFVVLGLLATAMSLLAGPLPRPAAGTVTPWPRAAPQTRGGTCRLGRGGISRPAHRRREPSPRAAAAVPDQGEHPCPSPLSD